MDYTSEDIFYAFGGKLVGIKQMKKYICDAIAKLPLEIIDYITNTCWFVGSMDDAYAYTFTGNDLQDQHLIFLSDDLLQQSKEQIQFSIVHEIGHVMLKHRNAVQEKQTKEEITNQEQEADAFAKKYGF